MFTQLILSKVRAEGRRSAATNVGNPGVDPEVLNPYSDKDSGYMALRSAWMEGWFDAARRHALRFDQAGHTMVPPHVCSRNPRAVCACCDSCTKACRPTIGEALIDATGIVIKTIRARLVKP